MKYFIVLSKSMVHSIEDIPKKYVMKLKKELEKKDYSVTIIQENKKDI